MTAQEIAAASNWFLNSRLNIVSDSTRPDLQKEEKLIVAELTRRGTLR